MTKPSKTTVSLIGIVTLILGCMAYAWVVSKGKTIFPVRVSVHYEPVTTSETRIWVSALTHQLSPAEFEQVVKTNREGRDFALGLFAYNGMTNHVRILIKYGANPTNQIEALNFSGASNAASLIQSVVDDAHRSPSNTALNPTPTAH
jgi:hypothetical protein